MFKLGNLSLYAALLAAVVFSGAAFGQPDRLLDTQTGWGYLYGATTSQVNALAANNQRVFNIERVGPNSYDAVAVSNSGPYAVSGSQVTFALTQTGLNSLINGQNRRIIDLEAYDNNGVENFAVVSVPNSGATAAGWGYLVRASQSDINSWIANSNPPLRLIDLDTYRLGGTKYYTAVAVNNTGSNQANWSYHWGRTAAQVTDLLTANNARLVDISIERQPSILNPTTLFNVIMVHNASGAGWWYSSLSSAQVDSLLSQNGSRLTAMTRYTDALGFTRFAVAMVDNINPESRRVRDIMTARSELSDDDQAIIGFRAKQVGGPVLTNLNDQFAFEPASAIKILHSARAMRGVQLGLESLDSLVSLNTTTNVSNSCPWSVPVTFTTLETTIQETMLNSSNHHTEALLQRYGRETLNAFASSYGLTNTYLHENHTIGCCGPTVADFNRLTANDAVLFYERIADGTILDEFHRYELYRLMTSHMDGTRDPWLSQLVRAEAASTNLSSGEIEAFLDELEAAVKNGGYFCGGTLGRYRSIAGWIRIPFRSSGPLFTPFAREYSTAMFLHGARHDTFYTHNWIDRVNWEQVRIPIRQALQSWDAACDPDAILSHPQSISVPQGGAAQFAATHTTPVGGRTYRWQYFNGFFAVDLFDDGRISGADTPNLTINGVTTADMGQYRLVITKPCGETESNPAFLTVTASCLADFDGNGVLNFFDFAAFIAAYNAQDPAADLAAPFGVLNFFDVSAFVSLYNQGCP
ncbi:MAG: serine hydrolase [Phycisphaerales bacterium]|nr:serine hydrolase [Phycisphaerales bacterium]